MNMKTKYFWEDISKNIVERFDTSYFEVKRPLPIDKNKTIIGMLKDKLGRRITMGFVG